MVEDNGGVYFVPAFSGLYAPYWKSNAPGIIAGLTRYANKGHLARAVLEATAFQARDVLEAMEKDSNIKLDALRADGGMVDSSRHPEPSDCPPDPARRDNRAGGGLRGRTGGWILQGCGGSPRQLGGRAYLAA